MNTLLKMFAWMPDMSEKRMLRQDMAWCRIFDLAEKKRRQLNCMDFVLNDGLSRLHIRGSTDSEKFMSDTKKPPAHTMAYNALLYLAAMMITMNKIMAIYPPL